MKTETRLVKVFLPLDLIELLEAESNDYTSFNSIRSMNPTFQADS